MKKSLLLLPVLILFISVAAINSTEYRHHEEEEIKEALLTGYVHGAFNELNPEAMAETFHKDFAIFSAKGEEISKYPIANWIESTRKQKNNPDFDPEKNKWEHKFVNVDVSGNAAAVELELYKDGEHVYTDYLSLLKFESGWKVVAKVYYQHPGE